MVMRQFITLILMTGLLIFSSCKQPSQEKNENRDSIDDHIAYVKYAQGFSVDKTPDYTKITVYNPWVQGQVLQRYILVDKKKKLPENLPEGTLIRTPLQRVVTYSTVQCGVLGELGRINTVAGVCEPEYVDISFIQQGIKNGTIINLGMAANPDVEKILLIEPEAILASPLKDAGYGLVEKIKIPIIDCVDYMESTPLGRAEWIRFHALFFNEEVLADSLFQSTVDAYENLKKLAASATSRPTVFTEMKYGNMWYLPGGRSYAAHLLKDAGAAYCWANDTTTGSLSLSFETVLDKAEKADFWLVRCYQEAPMSYADLVSEYSPYAYFDAYKKKSIYVCNTKKVKYYEDLPVHPDYILKDLIWIFHRDLVPGYEPKYYRKMEEH